MNKLSETKRRIESIQVIRAIAFILIFLSHVELISTGPIGVSLFLVLSGFCMTYAYLDRSEKTPAPSLGNNLKFTWRKLKKLYPLHVVTLLFVALIVFGGMVLHHASGKELAEQGAYFAANALLLQSWIPWRDGYFSFNAVSWYLSTTAFSYFLFPWVFQAIQSKDHKRIGGIACFTLTWMIFIAVILGIGNQIWGWTNGFLKWVSYISPFYRAGDFIIGLVAGYLFINFNNNWKRVQYTAAELFVIILMLIQVVLYDKGSIHGTNWTLTLFWLPTSILFIFLFAVQKGAVSQMLTKSKVLIWIGDISAEAFLIHQISIKAAEAIIKNKWVVAFIAFAATLVGTVIWRRIYSRYIGATDGDGNVCFIENLSEDINP